MDQEKLYLTMNNSGIIGIVSGIIVITVGITTGILMIVSGARLLLGKKNVII